LFPYGAQGKTVNLSGYGYYLRFLLACSVDKIKKVRQALGANIRRFRQKAGLTQEELAEKADFHPVYISQVESGHKALSIEAVWKISKALQVPMSHFFRGI
jgi:DNA-binding XRE family transcriptional regulator